MKYYDKVLYKNLDYVEAVKKAKLLEGIGEYAITREEWNGIHFMLGKTYYILLKDGTVLRDPSDIYKERQIGWIVVRPSQEAYKIINSYK